MDTTKMTCGQILSTGLLFGLGFCAGGLIYKAAMLLLTSLIVAGKG